MVSNFFLVIPPPQNATKIEIMGCVPPQTGSDQIVCTGNILSIGTNENHYDKFMCSFHQNGTEAGCVQIGTNRTEDGNNVIRSQRHPDGTIT